MGRARRPERKQGHHDRFWGVKSGKNPNTLSEHKKVKVMNVKGLQPTAVKRRSNLKT